MTLSRRSGGTDRQVSKMEVDTVKIRQAAIALITASLHAAQLKDNEQWESSIQNDYKLIGETFELTGDEFAGIPSLLAQINAMMLMLLSNQMGQEAEIIWEVMVKMINDMPAPRQLSQDEE